MNRIRKRGLSNDYLVFIFKVKFKLFRPAGGSGKSETIRNQVSIKNFKLIQPDWRAEESEGERRESWKRRVSEEEKVEELE